MQKDMEVCGEAATTADGLKLIRETHPDITIVDITLKQGNGLDLIGRIKEEHLATRMLVCSMHSESLYADRALQAGAMGFINKDHVSDDILIALRRINEGHVYVSEDAIDQLLRKRVGGLSADSPKSPIEELTNRELEVFERIGQGLKVAIIAQQMRLSSKTVECYRDRIRAKLDIADSTLLSHYATRWYVENH